MGMLVKKIIYILISGMAGYTTMKFVEWSRMPWTVAVMILVMWAVYCLLNGWFNKAEISHSHTSSSFEQSVVPHPSEPSRLAESERY